MPILKSLAEADVDIAGPDRGIGISLDLGIAMGVEVEGNAAGMAGGFQVAGVGLGGVVEGIAVAPDLEVDEDLGALEEEYALAVADVA